MALACSAELAFRCAVCICAGRAVHYQYSDEVAGKLTDLAVIRPICIDKLEVTFAHCESATDPSGISSTVILQLTYAHDGHLI